MSLYKQPGSDVWWASISVPGQPRLRRSTGEHDRVEAQRVHDELKASQWQADPTLKGKTWGNAVLKWVSVEPRSDSELLSLTKFAKTFGDRKLTDITPESIDKALSFCKSAGTYTRYRTMINAILRLSGVELKLLSRKDKKKTTRDWLTPSSWLKLHAVLPAHLKPSASFSVLTGLRQANALSLKWERVDLLRKVVWIEAADMKSDKPLTVPLSAEAVKLLKEHRKSPHTSEDYVFTFRGKPTREVKTAFQAACVRAGVGRYVDGKYQGFTWHGLRHTWATWHAQNGTPLEVLQKLGGWSDLRMVMNYSHHSPSYVASYAGNVMKRKK
jgi:integrase